jgi:hypothetical protein
MHVLLIMIVYQTKQNLYDEAGGSVASKVLRKHSLLETGSKNHLILGWLVGRHSTMAVRNANAFRTRRPGGDLHKERRATRGCMLRNPRPYLAIMILHSRAPSPSSGRCDRV